MSKCSKSLLLDLLRLKISSPRLRDHFPPVLCLFVQFNSFLDTVPHQHYLCCSSVFSQINIYTKNILERKYPINIVDTRVERFNNNMIVMNKEMVHFVEFDIGWTFHLSCICVFPPGHFHIYQPSNPGKPFQKNSNIFVAC